MVVSKLLMKNRKKPDTFLLPHGMPSNDGGFAFSSRVFPKASKIKPPYNSWNYQILELQPQLGQMLRLGELLHPGQRAQPAPPLIDCSPVILYQGSQQRVHQGVDEEPIPVYMQQGRYP